MVKRTIEISAEPAHLAVQLDQLQIRRPGADPRVPAASIPCEDIGLLIVDHPAVTYTHAALARLIDFGAAVLVCGQDHLPAGLLLPLSDHSRIVWRLDQQIKAGRPLRKRLWQQLVVAKIRAQAGHLPPDCPERARLLALAGQVRSGDPSNVEAQAAKVYWSAWLGPGRPFRRDPQAGDLNALLNYGYAVLRAAVARALVGVGLHPALGIHHGNRSNSFCLADDLLEPLRPFVDAKVQDLNAWGMTRVEARTKPYLLNLLTLEVAVGDTTGPLMVALHRLAASLANCFAGTDKELMIPVALDTARW
ncbi:MAG: type II CRISPR-associated endonuclease Cas1 [Phycisphaerae bacterium]|jgi:CRISPR-associated protein Cas1